jgi:hypothetical protein
MKQRSFRKLILTAALGAITVAALLAGCGSKGTGGHAEGKSQNGVTEVGVSFNAKWGLLVPPDTAKFIGLEIVDVTERSVTSTFRFPAQVYRVNPSNTNSTALASGFASPDEAEGLSDGQSLIIKTSGSESLAGKIKGLIRNKEKQSDAIEMIVEIADASPRLGVGDHVEVIASIEGAKAAVGVPRMALLQTLEGDFVYTVSGERLVRTAVKVGVLNDEFAEITDGLFEGDKVAVKPAMTLWLAELQSIRSGKACADGH